MLWIGGLLVGLREMQQVLGAAIHGRTALNSSSPIHRHQSMHDDDEAASLYRYWLPFMFQPSLHPQKSPASHCDGSLKQQNRATAPSDLPPQRLSLPLPHQIRSTSGDTRTQHARRQCDFFCRRRVGGARAGFLFWAGCELSSGGLALAVAESIRGNRMARRCRIQTNLEMKMMEEHGSLQ